MPAIKAAAPVARAAARNLPTRTPGVIRQFIRTLEPPTSPRPAFGVQTAAADWGRIMKARAQQAAIFFPGLGLILGWPMIAKAVFDGRM
ncbi:hypothetical protein F4780DRAFT_92688 [Xylariomycetidae sp. FL0641]|nr:hypothetical protein F4780DRAFT_92688 [Xylariomycetidae sp. FL0641]